MRNRPGDLAKGVEKIQRLLRQSSLEVVAEAIRKSFSEEKTFAKAMTPSLSKTMFQAKLKASSEVTKAKLVLAEVALALATNRQAPGPSNTVKLAVLYPSWQASPCTPLDPLFSSCS